MIQWGMPTLVELETAEENFQLCRQLGLDFVELNMNLPAFQVDRLEALAPLMRKYGVGVTIHADENLNPADLNPLVAQAYLETLRRTIRAAKNLNAPVINLHLSRGVYFTLPEGKAFLFERYREAYLSAMRAMREMCEKEADGGNVRICLENTDGWLGFQQEALELLLESDAFALTWDIGHSHCARLDDVPFLEQHAHRIAHLHIHDAARGKCHLELGCGEIDLDSRLRLADVRGCRCVLETKTRAALEHSVGWLRRGGWLGL